MRYKYHMSQGELFSGIPQAGAIVGGKYKLLTRLSEGSGGMVWEACDPKGCKVALKFLKWSPVKSKKVASERFKNEFAILKSLSHPNISDIYDFGIDPASGLYFFTTELLTEGNIKSMIGAPIPIIEEMLLQSLRALEYLRGHKLLHLDIKPQNLMLRHDGKHPEVVLIDFGLATFRPPDRPGGTANYMPPEIAARRLAPPEMSTMLPQPDHRSDLFSLGVTFYHCLTGVRPFHVAESGGKRTDSDATMKKLLEFEPPPPSRYRSDIPEYIDRIIMKLISKFPDDRYPSAIVAAQALQYRSPRRHEPESPQTLLSYLPKEGKLIGRKNELAIIEGTLKAIAQGTPHAACAVCIAGGRGVGRSRLLRTAKPIAQQLEMEATFIDEADELPEGTIEKIIEEGGSSKSYTHAVLIDEVDRLLTNGEGIRALVRRLRLQQRLPHEAGRRIIFIFTIDTDHTDVNRALIDLNLDETICHVVTLSNFTDGEISEYLAALLGERPDASVVAQLKRCTDGNPLFITEHLEEMIAAGRLFSLAGRPDAKTIKTIGIDFSHVPPPRSLADTVMEKLGVLTEDARRLALLIACWSRPVSAEELLATSGGRPTSHELLLLVSAGLIRRSSLDGRFAFVNSQAPRVILSNSTPDQVGRFHDSIAAYLKQKRAVRPEQLDLHVAYGSRRQARLPALARLADRALGGHDYLEASSHLNAMLGLIPKDKWQMASDTLTKLGRAYERTHLYDDAAVCYRQLGRLRAKTAFAQRELKIMSSEFLGVMEMRRRRIKRARRWFDQAAKQLWKSPKSIALRLKIENYLAGCDLREGLLEEAVARFERTASVAKSKLAKRERLAITNNELGEALLQIGDVHQALAILERELEHATEAGDHGGMANRHYLIGNALRHDDIRRYDDALHHYMEGSRIARARHMLKLMVQLQNGLGNLNLKMGRPDAALDHYREGLRLAQQVAGETTSVEIMIGMGLAAQKLNRPNDIIEYFEAALDFSGGPKGHAAGLIRRYRPTIYVSLGDAYYQKHDLERAESYLKEALALDEKQQLTPDIRYSLYGTYVEIFLERGDRVSARKHLPTLSAIAKNFPPAREHFEKISGRLSRSK